MQIASVDDEMQWLRHFLFQVKLNKQGIDLLEKTLIYDPVHRISAKKILEHSYFDGFDKKYVPAVWFRCLHWRACHVYILVIFVVLIVFYLFAQL